MSTYSPFHIYSNDKFTGSEEKIEYTFKPLSPYSDPQIGHTVLEKTRRGIISVVLKLLGNTEREIQSQKYSLKHTPGRSRLIHGSSKLVSGK
jgi:hypothetical protein